MQELLNHIKSNPRIMEDLVEDIVNNPAFLKKILIKTLPHNRDEPEVKTEKTEVAPWKERNYRPERSSEPDERKSKTTFGCFL